jgi:cell division protein FtsA
MKNNGQEPEYTMAVDIGTTKVAIMVGRISAGDAVVAAQRIIKSHGIRNGLIHNVDDAVRSVRACLADVKKQLAVKGITLDSIHCVNVGIAGEHIQTQSVHHSSPPRKHRSNPIRAKEIQTMYEEMCTLSLKTGRQILHVIPQSYCVDGNFVSCADIVGSTGGKIECYYHIISAEVEAIEKVKYCVEQCGLTVSNLVFEPLASAAAVLTDEEKQLGVALVDIGGGTSDIIIYADGEILSVHTVPYGGNIVSSDIAKVCNLTQEQAEALKVNCGACYCDATNAGKQWIYPVSEGEPPREITMDTLALIIRTRVAEIVNPIKHYLTNCPNEINKIVLTGGGAQLRGLREFVEHTTGCEVRQGDPYIFTNEKGRHSKRPLCATCVGLLSANNYSNNKKDKNIRNRVTKGLEQMRQAVISRIFNEENMEKAEVG